MDTASDDVHRDGNSDNNSWLIWYWMDTASDNVHRDGNSDNNS